MTNTAGKCLWKPIAGASFVRCTDSHVFRVSYVGGSGYYLFIDNTQLQVLYKEPWSAMSKAEKLIETGAYGGEPKNHDRCIEVSDSIEFRFFYSDVSFIFPSDTGFVIVRLDKDAEWRYR